jgi:hypothetical protein
MEEITKTENLAINEIPPSKGPFRFFSTDWKFNIVEDLNVQALYSRKAIYFFTCVFSVIFGGILMSINLKKVNRKDGIWVVLSYSIIYSVVILSVLSQFERSTIFTLLASMLGSFAFYNFFWKKYIGIETKYRPKPIWIPLIIGVTIFSLIGWAAIASM